MYVACTVISTSVYFSSAIYTIVYLCCSLKITMHHSFFPPFCMIWVMVRAELLEIIEQ